MITPDEYLEKEQRFQQLKMLRARRRASARGNYQPSPQEARSSPLLPPWMRPSSLETASPLGVDIPRDIRVKKKRMEREYPSSIGSLGSNY